MMEIYFSFIELFWSISVMLKYTIVSGDTFWKLSERYGCSVESIQSANPGINPQGLQIGQVINIPIGGVEPNGDAPPNARLDTTLNSRVPSWCRDLIGIINPAARKCNVPADLIAAIIYQESSGNIQINSTPNPNGGSDSGLMQVNQFTANELQQKYPDRFIGLNGSAKEIMLGTTYLRDMFDTIGDGHSWGIALRGYNSGPEGVDKRDLHLLPKNTGDRTYVDKVFRFWSDISTGRDPPADHYQSIFG